MNRLTQEQLQQIQDSFTTMKDRKDFVKVLNLVGEITGQVGRRPIALRQLTLYQDFRLSTKRYTSFIIRKRSGGQRIIHSPAKRLKEIQRRINILLQAMFIPNQSTMGFLPGRSILHNANLHTGRNYVFNIDLKDFFPSIDLHRIKACLKLKPFNLDGDREPLAFCIANLCCHPFEVEREVQDQIIKRVMPVLPQGAPTSPILTNIVCQRLDRKLSRLADRYGLRYSRYADDITFSSDHHVYQETSPFRIELVNIIKREGFLIKHEKTRLQKRGYRQEVTGLVVNESSNVRSRYVKEIRMYLHYWERYGYAKAESIFHKDLATDPTSRGSSPPTLENYLGGKLDFLRMVRSDNSGVYQRLLKRYQCLINRVDQPEGYTATLDDVVSVLSTHGLETAMKMYREIQKMEQ